MPTHFTRDSPCNSNADMAYLYAVAHMHRNGHSFMRLSPVRYRLQSLLVYSTHGLYNDSVFSLDHTVECLVNHESERTWKVTDMA